MGKKHWTRNQRIALSGVIVVAVMGILGWFVKIDLKISYIQDEIECIKANKANIKSLVVEEFLKTCPSGTTTTTIESTEEGIRFKCIVPK